MCHYVHLHIYYRKVLGLSNELHALCFCFNPCMICVISCSPEDFKSQLHKDRFEKHLIFISHWNEIDKSVPFVEIPFSTKPYKCMYVCQIQCTCCFSCIAGVWVTWKWLIQWLRTVIVKTRRLLLLCLCMLSSMGQSPLRHAQAFLTHFK